MIGRTTTARYWGCSATIATILGFTAFFDASSAWAQAEAAPPPAAPPAAAPTTPSTGVTNPPPPSALPPPAAATPSAVEAAPKPPTAAEAMPATRPDVLPPIDVGAWIRAGGIFQSATDPAKINDWHMDSAYVELHAGGKIHKNVSVTLNLASNMLSLFNQPGNGAGEGGAYVAVEDAIISFDFMDEFHLWAGHLLVPVDRSNAAGPFFMIPWNYPGFFSGPFVGAPAEGPLGRNNGMVLWGDIAGGKFSYFAGVFDNANVASSPLFSGKLRLALLDPEPGFWGNASYFGDKDILSFDLGAQVQNNGAVDGTTTYADINVDGLFEKKLGGGSFVTAEAAYYHFKQSTGGVSNSGYALLAYATPTVGVGNVQPMVRFQWETVKDNPISNPWNIDAAVSYLIKGPALRLLATYSHSKMLLVDATTMSVFNASSNSIQLGAQAIFF